MKKLKLKVNDLRKVYLLEEFGHISYVDDMINVVFITVEEDRVAEIEKVPFVINVKESRRGTLLAV